MEAHLQAGRGEGLSGEHAQTGVAGEDAVAGDKDHALLYRLGDQHPVERVLVVLRQKRRSKGVTKCYREKLEAGFAQSRFNS